MGGRILDRVAIMMDDSDDVRLSTDSKSRGTLIRTIISQPDGGFNANAQPTNAVARLSQEMTIAQFDLRGMAQGCCNKLK